MGSDVSFFLKQGRFTISYLLKRGCGPQKVDQQAFVVSQLVGETPACKYHILLRKSISDSKLPWHFDALPYHKKLKKSAENLIFRAFRKS